MTDHDTIDFETEEEGDWLHFGRYPNKGGVGTSVLELNKQGEVPLLQAVHVEDASADEVDEASQTFTDAVNMRAAELRSWADHECSDEGSVNPQKVRQHVVYLLETPKEDWGDSEVSDARQVIPFIARIREAH